MDPSREPTSPPEALLPDDVQHAVVPVSRWNNLWLPVLSLFILTTLVLGFIRHNLREVYRDNLGYWDSRMSNSAVERVSYANLWLKERRTDTLAVARDPFTARVLAAAAHRSRALEARLAAEHVLEGIARDNGFLGGAVADTECRIVAQKSVFTIHGKDRDGFYSLLKKHGARAQVCMLKISANPRKISNMVDELSRLGVTETTVFPDLEGLSREIKAEYGITEMDV